MVHSPTIKSALVYFKKAGMVWWPDLSFNKCGSIGEEVMTNGWAEVEFFVKESTKYEQNTTGTWASWRGFSPIVILKLHNETSTSTDSLNEAKVIYEKDKLQIS